MSYHEIEVVTRFQVHCKDCDFELEAHSLGEAENYARDHIEDSNDLHGSPHFSHVLIITPITLCGRQP